MVRNKRQKYEGTLASTRYFTITRQFSKGPSLVLVSKMISLHSDLVYTYEQQIFIDEIQVYSRRHIQLSSTSDYSGQPSILCFARFHWSERFSELFLAWQIHFVSRGLLSGSFKPRKKVESKHFQPVCYKGTRKK